MAEVHKGDREKTGFSDGKYPMATGAQVSSAIKLRHHGKGHSASSVLAKASAAISRLARTGKISQDRARELRAQVAAARRADGGKKD